MLTGENQEIFRQTVGDGSRWGLQISYVCQPRPLGLAHAVLTAETALGKEAFLMYLGDNLLEESVGEYLCVFEEKHLDSLLLLRKVPDPENYGIAEIAGDRVLRVVENRKNPRAIWPFPAFISFPRYLPVDTEYFPLRQGELEITDAIQNLLDRRKRWNTGS